MANRSSSAARFIRLLLRIVTEMNKNAADMNFYDNVYNSNLIEKLQKYSVFMREDHIALNISFTTENGLMGAFLYSPAAFIAVSVDLLKAKQTQGSLQVDPVKINVLTGTLSTDNITAQIEYNGDNEFRLKFLFPNRISYLYFVPIITQFNNPNFSSAAS